MFSFHNPIAGTETRLDKFGTAIDTFLLELLPHCGDGNCNIHITHSLSSLELLPSTGTETHLLFCESPLHLVI